MRKQEEIDEIDLPKENKEGVVIPKVNIDLDLLHKHHFDPIEPYREHYKIVCMS